MRQVEATGHVRPMGVGFSVPQLLRADDGNDYVVKFRSNGQGLRVLPNELIAGGCGHALELPLPRIAIVNVSHQLLDATEELTPFRGTPGLQFGCEFVPHGHSDPWPIVLPKAENLGDLAGILVFDTWTNNKDRSWNRLNVHVIKDADGRYRVIIFDQGWVFGGTPNWSTESLKQQRDLVEPPFMAGCVYDCLRHHIRGEHPFDSWLLKVESLPPETIWQCIQEVPDEWGVDLDEREALADYLIHRRNLIRPIIMGLKRKFPQWA